MEEERRRELEHKVALFKLLQDRSEVLRRHQELLLQKISEVQQTILSLEELEKAEKLVFSLSPEAKVFGKIVDRDKILVDVGAGIVLEKTREEAKQILEKRRAELEKALSDASREMQSVAATLQSLVPEIQKLAR